MLAAEELNADWKNVPHEFCSPPTKATSIRIRAYPFTGEEVPDAYVLGTAEKAGARPHDATDSAFAKWNWTVGVRAERRSLFCTLQRSGGFGTWSLC